MAFKPSLVEMRRKFVTRYESIDAVALPVRQPVLTGRLARLALIHSRHAVRPRETTEDYNRRTYGKWFDFYKQMKGEQAHVAKVQKIQSTLRFMKGELVATAS